MTESGTSFYEKWKRKLKDEASISQFCITFKRRRMRDNEGKKQ